MKTWADRFLPPDVTDPDRVRQLRQVLLGAGLGLFFANTTALSYLMFGSRWSAASIQVITVGLLLVPFAIRRGIRSQVIGNVMTALTAQAALLVAVRSGGFESPAVSWCFILPTISYLASGRTAAIVWSLIAVAIVGFFFIAERAGITFAQDFSESQQSILRMSGYPGVILSSLGILLMVERVRVASQRALDEANRGLERQRILRDMHDGVGSQLMGLLVRARSNQLAGTQLVRGLESALDDLRLAVDSLDPSERSLEIALGELRLRTQVHCASAGIELSWHCHGTGELTLASDTTLDVLRACQEMLANSMRHAAARKLEFAMNFEQQAKAITIVVQDDGVGFDVSAPPRTGRGLTSLRARAQKLGGQLTLASMTPGIAVTLRFPTQLS